MPDSNLNCEYEHVRNERPEWRKLIKIDSIAAEDEKQARKKADNERYARIKDLSGLNKVHCTCGKEGSEERTCYQAYRYCLLESAAKTAAMVRTEAIPATT